MAADVWLYDLDAGASADALAVLSPLERKRAAAFVRAADRDRFVAAHARMRSILGDYLQRDPRAIELAYGPHGRPYLAGEALAFNLSHSEDRAALAVAAGVRIGIDLERERDDVDVAALVRQVFAPKERADFAGVDPGQRRPWFYRQWVAKEAVLKAHGGGWSVPAGGFAVRFVSADTASVRSATQDPGEQWAVRMLSCGPGWHAAVAVDAPPGDVHVTMRDDRRRR